MSCTDHKSKFYLDNAKLGEKIIIISGSCRNKPRTDAEKELEILLQEKKLRLQLNIKKTKAVTTTIKDVNH